MNYRVTQKTYRIGNSKVTIPIIVMGEKHLLVDRGLPASLTRLIPHAWGNAPSTAWKPFVDEAIRTGRL
jgi:hypothetical protein